MAILTLTTNKWKRKFKLRDLLERGGLLTPDDLVPEEILKELKERLEKDNELSHLIDDLETVWSVEDFNEWLETFWDACDELRIWVE